MVDGDHKKVTIKICNIKKEDQDLRNIYLGMNPRYVIYKLCKFGLSLYVWFSEFSLSLYVCILSFNKEIMISTLQCN